LTGREVRKGKKNATGQPIPEGVLQGPGKDPLNKVVEKKKKRFITPTGPRGREAPGKIIGTALAERHREEQPGMAKRRGEGNACKAQEVAGSVFYPCGDEGNQLVREAGGGSTSCNQKNLEIQCPRRPWKL